MNHTRCILCRSESGSTKDQPFLCSDCVDLVAPHTYDHEANRHFADGYAAALWHAFVEKRTGAPAPRDPEELDKWCATWLAS